jgi:threonine synthase
MHAAEHGGAAGPEEDDLGTLKLAELKDVCKDLGLKISGKKDELVERIRAHREEKAAPAPHSTSPRQASTPAGTAAGGPGQDAGEEEAGSYRWGSEDSSSGIWDNVYGAEVQGGGVGKGVGVPVALSGPEAPWGVIKYMSTRGHPRARWRGRLAEALREGQANDGGLLVPTVFPDLLGILPSWSNLSFAELAAEMSKIWMGMEWDADILSEIFKHETFTSFADLRDPLPVRKVKGHKDVHVLELFHGPTGAPQDSITLPLARLLDRITERRKSRATVVVGWTDGLEALSVANACKGSRSMTSFFVAPLDLQPTAALEAVCAMGQQASGAHKDNGQTHVVFVPSDRNAVAGIVKDVWQDDTVRRQYLSTSLGGINAAHVLLAVTNYVYAYLKLRPMCDGPIRVALDPGDYTQAAAAYYARLSGVPIEAVIAAETSALADDALLPGLERLAFEFCGRDPGRVVQAAATGRGIQDLVASICPPDFVRVGVSQEAEKAAAASTTTPLCGEACRALAAGTSLRAAAEVPLLVVAPRRAGGSVDDGTGPASTISGSAAAPGKRKVLVSSVISIRDFLADTLPPYAPLSVPGPQAVAALNHLKRLGPRARDRTQRVKVLDLSDLLMTALDEHVPSLNVKDTCLALNAVADAMKNRMALESGSAISVHILKNAL